MRYISGTFLGAAAGLALLFLAFLGTGTAVGGCCGGRGDPVGGTLLAMILCWQWSLGAMTLGSLGGLLVTAVTSAFDHVMR